MSVVALDPIKVWTMFGSSVSFSHRKVKLEIIGVYIISYLVLRCYINGSIEVDSSLLASGGE